MAPTERRRRASEEATEWWLQLQSSEMTRQQREAFIDWLRESSVHVAEMLRVASMHGALERFENWTRIATDHVGSDEDVIVELPDRGDPSLRSVSPSEAATSPRAFPLRWPIAAAFACIAVATVLLLPGMRGQVMQTDRGERREVALADGSVVQIDPESRLRVRFEERSRRVFLYSGRALFRVAKNPDRPFLVEADGTIVRAVGTAFGVERKEQGIVVTVSEGKVAIEGVDAMLRAPAVPDAPEASARMRSEGEAPRARILLTANEQVTVSSGGAATQISKVDSARALAWAEGRLNFENTPIREVVEQFNRYNSIQLQVEDAELARRPISGVFNAANPEGFIAFIQATTSVKVEREGDGDIVIASDR
jgi:transmembrane sensor